jgi:hypothetical protein
MYVSFNRSFISEQVFDDYQRYGSFRTLDDLMAKSLLWLIPKDHILDYPKPTMPHVMSSTSVD